MKVNFGLLLKSFSSSFNWTEIECTTIWGGNHLVRSGTSVEAGLQDGLLLSPSPGIKTLKPVPNFSNYVWPVGYNRSNSLSLFILTNFWGWHWLIKYIGFRYTILHHPCVVFCIHHPKSSPLPWPFMLPSPPSISPLPSSDHHTVVCVQEPLFFFA